MANSSPPWDAYRVLTSCRLVSLDKSPGVRPMGIGDTLRRALDKLVTRASGDQAKKACGNLQLCAGLEAGIEGATHSVGQRRLERLMAQRGYEEAAEAEEAEEEEEEGGEGIVAITINLNIETEGTEEEAAEGLEAALRGESQEMEIEDNRRRDEEEE